MVEVAQQIQQFMAEADVLARGVEVEEEVATVDHRVKEEAGNVLLEVLLLLSRLRCGFGLRVERVLVVGEGVDVEVGLVHGAVLVAVEEGGQGLLLLAFFAGFGDEDGLSPEVDEGVLALGRVEEQEIEVHSLCTIYITISFF